eukprot:7351999-Pyramimonas_sp.AAC.1
MENSFAERIAAPLDPLFSWDKLGEAIADSMQELVDDPTMGIILYTVAGLHPHQWPMGATPRQPG